MKMNSSIKILYSVCKAELITEQATCRIIERYRIKKYETQLEQLDNDYNSYGVCYFNYSFNQTKTTLI